MADKQLIYVYKGRNSPARITVKLNGVPITFITNGVTKLGIVIAGVEYNTSEYINFDDDGEVTFTLGSVPNPPLGKVTGRLVMYTPEYPLGKPIITEKTDFRLQFQFV